MTSRPRRLLTEAAEQAGFGRVVRIHYQYSSLAAVITLLTLTSVPAAISVLPLLLEDTPYWRLPIVGWAALLCLGLLWLRWGPVASLEGRHYLAVAEGGLVVWQTGLDVSPTPVPWDRLSLRIVGTVPNTRQELVWTEDGERQVLPVPSMSRHDDLLRAVRQGGPLLPLSKGRVALRATTGIAAAAALWFAILPETVNLVAGRPPHHIKDFGRMCFGGEPFGRAAEYTGPGPHPVAVFLGTDSEDSYPEHTAGFAESDERWPPATELQLVACARLVGTNDSGSKSCSYSGGYSTSSSQGRWQVEVYEARTGRPVHSFPADGTMPEPGCSPRIMVNPDSDRSSDYETPPDDAAFDAALHPLVTNPAP
ncbi:hypothetical protein [Amycolatopsis suaedae]|uniref:Uncharacterized protein n=1 Tax=Amycolatopsis suaedae TaxID=2510978 RepID=A0A4Q7JEN9_9PSEU|nr:hypothetical protein [Amycolatopsis suaedae]RZQ65778.1 hypothetical protein EWH70_01455 [Amycolatopsis suaedae]